MRWPARHVAALGSCAAFLLFPGCGSSDDPEGNPLPRDAAAAISARLDEVQRRYDAGTGEGNTGACQDIENDSYKAIDETVAGLPEDVDPDVREALESSLSRLRELTQDGCDEANETPAETETEAPEQPVAPTTVPEQTIPEQTETQPTAPEKEKPKKKEDNGNGNGQGNGGQPAPVPVPVPEDG